MCDPIDPHNVGSRLKTHFEPTNHKRLLVRHYDHPNYVDVNSLVTPQFMGPFFFFLATGQVCRDRETLSRQKSFVVHMSVLCVCVTPPTWPTVSSEGVFFYLFIFINL